MKKITGFGLLASAFAPLVALLAILMPGEHRLLRWVVLATCAVAVLDLHLVLRSLAKLQTREITTTAVRMADERVLSFTSTYIVPVVVALLGGSRASVIVATSALVGVLAFIYVRAGLYHLNPTLAILGYRLYEITEENGRVVMLLARVDHLPQRGLIRCRYLGRDVAIKTRE